MHLNPNFYCPINLSLIPNLYRQNQLRIQNYAEYDFVFVGADYEVFRAKITVAYFNIILR